MKKLLILGGSGFFGQSIIDCGIKKHLFKHKINQIYSVSRSGNLKYQKKKFIKINIIKKNFLEIKKIPETNYIIYCLNSKNLKEGLKMFEHFFKLVQDLKKKPKILFTSSGAVYGKNLSKTKSKESDGINLSSINKFTGYKKKYVKEKIMLEQKFVNLGSIGYDVSIARCFTFVGKNILEYKYAISDLLNNLILKKELKLNTNINVYRSYMDSNDLVKWLIKIVKHSNKKCPIYNVGSDYEINLRKLVKILAKNFNKKYKLNKIISKKIDYYVPSVAKARKNLNLNISINLMDSINSIIKS